MDQIKIEGKIEFGVVEQAPERVVARKGAHSFDDFGSDPRMGISSHDLKE